MPIPRYVTDEFFPPLQKKEQPQTEIGIEIPVIDLLGLLLLLAGTNHSSEDNLNLSTNSSNINQNNLTNDNSIGQQANDINDVD